MSNPAGPPAISVSALTKTFTLPHEKRDTLREWVASGFRRMSYDRFDALRDVSFEVARGTCFGIVGSNGSGKSTLLKILAGIFPPSSGTVQVRGQISPFLELGVGFNPDLSARDNVYLNGAVLGLRTREIDALFDEIISFAELERFVDQKLKNFSSGMQVRLAFSVAIKANADIYLMDEVLAVGDMAFQHKCFDVFRRFRKEGKTIVLVSHDLASVRQFCEQALYLRNGEVMALGPTAQVLDKYVYEDRPADAGRTLPVSRPASVPSPLRIIAARVLDKAARPQRQLISGDAMSIELEFAANPDVLADAVFEVVLSTDLGLTLFIANTDTLQVRPPQLAHGLLRIAFPSLAIGAGHVTVSAAVRNRQGRPLDYRAGLIEFEVLTDAAASGLVRMPVTAEFVAATAK
jgi:lipopolysaccharide transport system ATP-binding protein